MWHRFRPFRVKPQILLPEERDRYENEKYYYENERYHRWENERYHGRESGRNERETGRYTDRWENQRYTTSYESERYPNSYENEHYSYEDEHYRASFEHEGHEQYDRECFDQKMSNYIDPRSHYVLSMIVLAARIPSTRPEQDYLAYLDSLYTPLEGLRSFFRGILGRYAATFKSCLQRLEGRRLEAFQFKSS